MTTGRQEATRSVAIAQGAYFVATGIWPLLHMPSFEAVTGPKVDKWLVRTVGVLVSVVGGVLVAADLPGGRRGRGGHCRRVGGEPLARAIRHTTRTTENTARMP